MRKFISLIVIVLLFAASLSADERKIGTSGAQFLKIGVGSKYIGMGEASAAVATDVYAMYWNPAGLAEIEGNAISFTNVDYLLDVQLNYLAYAKAFEDVGVFGFSVAALSMDEMEITTFEDQDGTGDMYDAGSYALGLSYARQFNAQFSFGLSVKYINEKIHNETASGFAFDFGTMLYTGFRSLRLGVSINNMGPEMEFSGNDLIVNYDEQNGGGANDPVNAELQSTPYELPMIFRFGMAYDFIFNEKSKMTFASEISHPNDNAQQGAVGAEFNYDDLFYLRGGYKINYDEQGISFGGGLNTVVSGETRLLLDYSWQDYGRLNSTQRFSVGFTF